MRVAWLGPEPQLQGGVPFMATLLLGGLAAQGVEVDAYVVSESDGLPPEVARATTGVRLIEQPTGWEWNRWYSRTAMGALTSGQLTRLRAQRTLLAPLVANHARSPYDVVYQFSQFETSWMRGHERELPPLVVHPEVHAAGELRWHRLERDLAQRCEPAVKRAAVRAMLIARSELQRRSAGRAAAYIAPSRVFAQHLAADYGIAPDRLHVVPNPIDLERFVPPAERLGAAGASGSDGPRPIELVFVSRLAVRKGVEMIVELSRRLRDEAGRVHLTVLGGKALFSDYTRLLADLDPAIARHQDHSPAACVVDLYRGADALLAPSHYEPFALTVGEALACGLPVVASSVVGAAEGVDRRVCRVFPAGDADAFESAVRALIADLRGEGRPALRRLARTEAQRLFALPVVARQVVEVLEQVRARGPAAHARFGHATVGG